MTFNRVIVVVVEVATLSAVEANELLHPFSEPCHQLKHNTTLHCDVTDNTKQYEVDNFRWNDIRKFIIRNANHLVLDEPLCSNHTKEVEIHNADSVTTKQGTQDCGQQLVLHSSTGVTINHGVDDVKMFSSEAHKVILPRVNGLVLQDSRIEEVAVAVNKNLSMTDSTIEVVTRLVMDESSSLSMEDSELGRVVGFIYNSTKMSTLMNVMVERVGPGGFKVLSGRLTLDNSTLSRVASMGMQVMNGATLILRDCEIEATVFDSILVNEGNIYFKNVTIGQEQGIFLTFLNITVPLYPLAFMSNCPGVPIVGIAIGMVVSLILGALIAFVLIAFMMRHRAATRCKADVIQLHNIEHNTPQGATNYNMDKPTSPPLPLHSLATAPKAHTTPQIAPTERAPKPPPPKRSPAPLPRESLPQGKKYEPSAKPSPVTLPPTPRDQGKAAKDDERNVLPSPPPPPPLSPTADDEELYDDVQNASRPKSSLMASMKMKLPSMTHRFQSSPPPPLSPTTDDEELYDDVQNASKPKSSLMASMKMKLRP
ncbi:hypothetical protein GWK47_004354 [Chionoecetes opilio]|uniref:Uncharacterized protein n=1 Tax=Chionoecetes opilio TaxID=41210 RepID=A0A8J5CMW4_CHIOP|nr:hypothetical protein GWK47_004354 [Chionoecetes opilio]